MRKFKSWFQCKTCGSMSCYMKTHMKLVRIKCNMCGEYEDVN